MPREVAVALISAVMLLESSWGDVQLSMKREEWKWEVRSCTGAAVGDSEGGGTDG